MSNKQTAVEWLLDILGSHIDYPYSDKKEIIEQALQLEREQIEKAYIEGMEFIPVDPNKYTEDAEQYYTQTYGKCTPQS